MGKSTDAEDRPAHTSVQVVHRSLRVLEALSAAHMALSLTTISERVGLHRSTTLRILRTLADDGYTVFEPRSRTWIIGPAILRLQAGARFTNNLQQSALSFMQQLSSDVGETVQLAAMVDNEVCYLEKIEPPEQQVRVLSEVGDRRPLYCTALGKALMSGLEPGELSALIAKLDLVRHTDRTITDPTVLRREVEEAARRGYSLDRREYNRAVQCSAAPIRDPSGNVVAALSVSTVGLEDGSEAFQQIIVRNMETARRISEALGWQERTAAE